MMFHTFKKILVFHFCLRFPEKIEFFIPKDSFFHFVCINVCLHICLHTMCMLGAHESQKKAWEPLELELTGGCEPPCEH